MDVQTREGRRKLPPRVALAIDSQRFTRVCFTNAFPAGRRVPQAQGLKPAFLLAHDGTAEVVPCPKSLSEPKLFGSPRRGKPRLYTTFFRSL